MNILFLTHYFPPEGNAPASRTFEHARRWVESGASVTVITSNPNVPHGQLYSGYRNRLKQVEFLDGIRVIRVWTYLAANAGNIRRTLNYLSFMISAVAAGISCSRPNVIVATSPQFFCGWAGVILSRLLRIPFVLEIRDIWPDSIAAVGAINHKLPLLLLSKLEQCMYRASDDIVTVGNGYRDTLIQRGVPSNKIRVIPNGADLDRFKPRIPIPLNHKKNAHTHLFTCVYIGTIGMASRLDLILKVATLFQVQNEDRFHFYIVGDGSDRNRLQLESENLRLRNVTFTGLVKKSEIPNFIDRADACIVHLRKDPLFETVLPSKLFEAMAMAKPIILGVQGAAADLLQMANAGISITPEDPKGLIEALRKLQESSSFCQKLGEAGRKFVCKEYNRDHFANVYLARILEKYR
ncbi:glycosyltransferase family 4 protein [bacterium]|nr:glycosyltransferase family 4 protein [bacterium]